MDPADQVDISLGWAHLYCKILKSMCFEALSGTGAESA